MKKDELEIKKCYDMRKITKTPARHYVAPRGAPLVHTRAQDAGPYGKGNDILCGAQSGKRPARPEGDGFRREMITSCACKDMKQILSYPLTSRIVEMAHASTEESHSSGN